MVSLAYEKYTSDDVCENYKIRNIIFKRYINNKIYKEFYKTLIISNKLSPEGTKEYIDKYHKLSFPWYEKEKQKEIDKMCQMYNNIHKQ